MRVERGRVSPQPAEDAAFDGFVGFDCGRARGGGGRRGRRGRARRGGRGRERTGRAGADVGAGADDSVERAATLPVSASGCGMDVDVGAGSDAIETGSTVGSGSVRAAAARHRRDC